MALDWIGLNILARELTEKLNGYRVQEVFQPAAERLAIELYGKEREFLFIDTNRENSFLYLAFEKESNPDFPPPFCSLLRKYLTGKRLQRIDGVLGDRTCVLSFYDEQNETYYLRVSLSGRTQDIALILPNGEVPATMQGLAKQENIDPFANTHPQAPLAEVSWHLSTARQNWLEKNTAWFVAQARELTPGLINWLLNHEDFPETENLSDFFQQKINTILAEPTCQLISDELGVHGFSIYPLSLPENSADKIIARPNLLTLLNEFGPRHRESVFLRKAKATVLSKIKQLLEKAQRRKKEYEDYLLLCHNYRELERNADLLNSQRSKIRSYQKSAIVIDFYSDNYQEKEIPLEQNLSLNENIHRYFQKARKYKRAIEKTVELIANQDKNIRFYERLQEQLRHETNHCIVEQQLEKLCHLNIIKKAAPKIKKKNAVKSRLRMFYSSEQAEIYTGRNDKENDFLIRHIGHKEDLWFHVHGVSGAHVILKKHPTITEASITEAAQLAAYFSQKKKELKAEIMYTPLKYVHRQPGSVAGLASVIKHETITVNVDLNIIKKLEKNNRFIHENNT